MKNAHTVDGWRLTPATCTSSYDSDKRETITITKLDSGKLADGYHVESPTGACFFVQRWASDATWTSQKLDGTVAAAVLRHQSPTLKSLLERLRNATRVAELEARLRLAYAV